MGKGSRTEAEWREWMEAASQPARGLGGWLGNDTFRSSPSSRQTIDRTTDSKRHLTGDGARAAGGRGRAGHCLFNDE